MSTPRKRATKKITPPKPDLGTIVHDLRTDYIQCRDFGHSWRPYTARWDARENAYRTELRCSRCKTIRARWIGPRGQQLDSRYDYSDGYLVQGIGRLTGSDRDALRLESVLRVLPEDADEDAG